VESFLIFLAVGFAAQLADGALGMGYGIISSSVLVAFGVPPATASATVHGAKLFTTAASAASHTHHKNVNWRLFVPMMIAGVIGGVLGVALITSVDGKTLKPWVLAYFAVMGFWILYRAYKNAAVRHIRRHWMAPLGLTGGFLDANEPAMDAMRREVAEETGLELADLKLRRALVRARHLELIFSARPIGHAEVKTSEIYRLGWFARDSLPEGTTMAQSMLIGEVLADEFDKRTGQN